MPADRFEIWGLYQYLEIIAYRIIAVAKVGERAILPASMSKH